jgi:hypothetical protein
MNKINNSAELNKLNKLMGGRSIEYYTTRLNELNEKYDVDNGGEIGLSDQDEYFDILNIINVVDNEIDIDDIIN